MIAAGPPGLTQFQNVMPWVMMAPFGCPVVPEVYMMVEMSSSVTTSAFSSGFELAIAASYEPPAASNSDALILQSLASDTAASASSASWIISEGAASPTMYCSSGTGTRVFNGRNTAPIRPQAN